MATSTGVDVDEEPHSTTTGGTGDSLVTEYATYDDFLDSHEITQTDLYYLEVS